MHLHLFLPAVGMALAGPAVPLRPVTSPDNELRVRQPAEVGMSADRLEIIDRVVRRGIWAGGYPGAAVIVGRKGAIVYEQGFGALAWGTTARPVAPDESIYDVASLTKVVGTTTAAMILYDRGKLDLDAKVQRYLPEFTGGKKGDVTVRMLLSHRSGLPAGRELWRKAKTPAAAKRLVLETRLAYTPGRMMIYSDLGADVLGWVVERAAGEPIDRFLKREVFTPLGMRNTMFRPADSLKYRIAPTEQHPPRGYPVRGEVHDENAFALGGVAGHAGLFSSARDLAVFAQMMLNGGQIGGVRVIADSTVRLFTEHVRDARALGWEVGNGEHGAGQFLGRQAFGHTGYTGTSLWIDPEREMFVVLLTNRVHAARVRRPAVVIADVRADVADAAALAVLDEPHAIPVLPASFRADIQQDWNKPYRRARVRQSKAPSPAQRVPAAKSAPTKASIPSKSVVKR